MVTALIEMILAIYEDDEADAVILAAVSISIKVIGDIVKALVLADVNLHFVTFLLSLGVITL